MDEKLASLTQYLKPGFLFSFPCAGSGTQGLTDVSKHSATASKTRASVAAPFHSRYFLLCFNLKYFFFKNYKSNTYF
jgi:hypothetical protein